MRALIAIALLAAFPVAGQERLDIRFSATIGDRPLACGERYDNVGAGKSSIAIADFRLFVSKIELIQSGGMAVPLILEQDNAWQYQGLALLDFENGTASCNIGTAAMPRLGLAYDGLPAKKQVLFSVRRTP
ncbi:MAG: hypothetical protein EXR39_02365 [Betaproteobacteria bacterium]|nr:hypothetical protein [Betaproteobacteria bacterium]